MIKSTAERPEPNGSEDGFMTSAKADELTFVMVLDRQIEMGSECVISGHRSGLRRWLIKFRDFSNSS